MTAVVQPIVIEQGATFFLEFIWRGESETTPGTPGEPIDLSNSKIRMQIRKYQQDPIKAQATNEPPDNYISHNGAGGKITVRIPPAATSLIDVKSAKYDLEVELPLGNPEPDVFRVLEGNVKVKPNFTQDPSDPVLGS